jgi:PAS domain S-box-containing protein
MVFVNERVRDYYGVEPEAAIQDLQYTLGRVHPDDLPRVMASSVEAYRTLSPWTQEFRVRMGDDVRWQLGSSVPEREADGSVLFTGFFQDITDRKAAEAERERLLSELGQKNKELETLVYVASHDLRSPLVNVLGFSQRLEKAVREALERVRGAEDLGALQAALEPALAERMPTALRFIQASGTKMDALIGGLLKVSRAGRVELKPEVLDLQAMLRGLLDAMAFQIQQAGAFVEVGPLPPCMGDPGQIGQVLTNLLDNALKYRDPGRPLRISVSGREEGGFTVLEVADTGIGIEPESQDKVFVLFHRLDPLGSVAGEGLGLTLVQRMVERNGGRVWLTSEPGVGTRFSITLPRP